MFYERNKDFFHKICNIDIDVKTIEDILTHIRNFCSPTTIVAAITSRLKTNMPTHVHIENKCLPCNSVILLEHIRIVDKRRLEEYQGKLTQEEISELDKALAISLDLRIREDKKNGQDKSSK